MTIKHKLFSFIQLSILVVSLIVSSITLRAQDVETVLESVTLENVKTHLTYLASDELKGRNVGTEGINQAADYIADQLKEYGLTTIDGLDGYFQNLKLIKSDPPSEGVISIEGEEFTFPDDFVVIGGDNISGEYCFKQIDFKNEKEFKKRKLENKIVIGICGDGETKSVQGWFYNSKEKIKKLKQYGAIGLIELYQSNQVPYKYLKQQFNRSQMTVGDGDSDNFFHVWMDASDESKMGMVKKGGKGMVTLKVKDKEALPTKNVVGMVEGTDSELKNEYLIYSAHYDHVGVGQPDASQDSIYNGARDNAVGVTAVLEAARYIAQNPTKRSAIFALWTAEEKGLLGSRYFVENSPIALDDIVFNFNIDNGGYNDTTIVFVAGLERTTGQAIIDSSSKAFGLGTFADESIGLFDRSDNVNFAKVGIPAPTFSLGFRAFDAEIFKYYHQVTDEVDSLDFNYLLKYFRAYALASSTFGNADEVPFWVEGDKYYDKGVELYGR